MNILNLYAGIGGNRKLWKDVTVTAVESNQEIANIYKDFYPNDVIVIGDAHQYLLDHYSEFDFVWTSPPCKSHSEMRQNLCVNLRGTLPVYPDMSLYQEIIFLKHNFKGLWIVENTQPYYDFLIPPTFKLQRHVFWSNFRILFNDYFPKDNLRKANVNDLQNHTGFDLSNYNLTNKREVLRNCVYPPLGEYIFLQAKHYFENDEYTLMDLLF